MVSFIKVIVVLFLVVETKTFSFSKMSPYRNQYSNPKLENFASNISKILQFSLSDKNNRLLKLTTLGVLKDIKMLWKKYKQDYGKRYKTVQEEEVRKNNFVDNYIKVLIHNQKHKEGFATYHLKMNKFADMNSSEFKQVMLGYKNLKQNETRSSSTYLTPFNVVVPESLDWRAEGYVTEVKDQGQCGSCWAFSATGALEGQHYKKTKQLIPLSEQNLIDCSLDNDGCNGGNPGKAFKYVKDNNGIDTMAYYPYETAVEQCRFNEEMVGATCTGHHKIAKENEDDLLIAVATEGPISVSIDASHHGFRHYGGGVYFDQECSSENLTHSVLVVGYGVSENNEEYWLVKNIWGADWGEQGYIRMARNKDNNCGIANEATYPLV